ncbi:hypothetical protein [Sphingobium lignivorans]|uniref:Uncharacterized protein n=1 Tax=Sphingobium lignivorans TaxID=2735886 RepID=A0ABR6NGX7_9SPHN|nr:hypothetical protein [Sphingobium lignivorans]MBB5986534.1 hypothetical protein [Sphingobium lignivorans]
MDFDTIVIARRLQDTGATIRVQTTAAEGERQFRFDASDAMDFLTHPRAWTATGLRTPADGRLGDERYEGDPDDWMEIEFGEPDPAITPFR